MPWENENVIGEKSAIRYNKTTKKMDASVRKSKGQADQYGKQ